MRQADGNGLDAANTAFDRAMRLTCRAYAGRSGALGRCYTLIFGGCNPGDGDLHSRQASP